GLHVTVLVQAPPSHSLHKFTKPGRNGHGGIHHVPEAQSIQGGDAQTTPAVGAELYASDCAVVLEWLAERISGPGAPEASHATLRSGKHRAAIRTEYCIH